MEQKNQDYVEELMNSDVVVCLDTLQEADEAVKTINQDMFNMLSRLCGRVARTSTYPDQDCKLVLRNFEKRYKKERNIKHMPGSYRSAKSAIIAAVRHGVPLTDSIGEAVGKTQLEKETKEAKKVRTTAEVSSSGSSSDRRVEYNLGKAESLLRRLIPYKIANDYSPEDVKIFCDCIETHVQEIRDTYGV